MYLTPEQLRDVKRVKIAGERGLEKEIYDQHVGDKQVHALRNGINSSYRYINRPLPCPNGLHLLYPNIDTGDVFLSERKWKPEWEYSRDNIPNVLSPEKVVNNYDKDIAKYNNGEIDAAQNALRRERESRYLSPFASLLLHPEGSKARFITRDDVAATAEDLDAITDNGLIENYKYIQPGYYGADRPTSPYATMDAKYGYNTVASQVSRLSENIKPFPEELLAFDEISSAVNQSFLDDNAPRMPKRPVRTLPSQAAMQQIKWGNTDITMHITIVIAIITLSLVIGLATKYKLKM